MTIANKVDYSGKRCVVVGGASGMGEGVIQLLNEQGAEVIGLDLNPIKEPVNQYIQVNLGERESIDAAVAQIPDGVDAYFHVAGMAGSNDQIPWDLVMKVNFLAPRYMLEKMVPKMKKDSAILIVASIASWSWPFKTQSVKDIIQDESWDGALEKIRAVDGKEGFFSSDNSNAVYMFSKVLVACWGIDKAWELAEKHIRLNLTGPGATRTGLHAEFVKMVGLPPGSALGTSPYGQESVPQDQARAMLLLNSDMANYISGQLLYVDYAFMTQTIYRSEGPPK
jgi:NAD(P)-dependent dehydrogenase (short-subunit alcohol dehydrogenase family)